MHRKRSHTIPYSYTSVYHEYNRVIVLHHSEQIIDKNNWDFVKCLIIIWNPQTDNWNWCNFINKLILNIIYFEHYNVGIETNI